MKALSGDLPGREKSSSTPRERPQEEKELDDYSIALAVQAAGWHTQKQCGPKGSLRR